MGDYRIVHYINNFFAGIGGEEMAHIKPELREGPVGPGMVLEKEFKGEGKVVGTVICGDSYFNENIEEAKEEILSYVKELNPDIFIAGPAFNAGRYGVACGTIAKEVEEKLDIPVITGMFPENPGVEMFKKDVHIIETKGSAADMRNSVPKIARLGLKMLKGEEIGPPEEEGYIQRDIRINYFHEKRGSLRAVEMILDKVNGKEYITEYSMPDFGRVEPAESIVDMSKVKVALVTSGGVVPTGNPDRIESSSATKFGIYSIEGQDTMSKELYTSIHGGYDRTYVLEDPNRVVPLDVMRDIEKEGVIGSLNNYYIVTTGTGTSVGNARKFAEEFSKKLVEDGIGAVLLTST